MLIGGADETGDRWTTVGVSPTSSTPPSRRSWFHHLEAAEGRRAGLTGLASRNVKKAGLRRPGLSFSPALEPSAPCPLRRGGREARLPGRACRSGRRRRGTSGPFRPCPSEVVGLGAGDVAGFQQLLRDLHGAELRPAHGAEVRHLGLGGERLVVEALGRLRVEQSANWSRQRKAGPESASSRMRAAGWPLARSAAWAAIL